MKRKEKIILVGGGGHCKVVIDALRKASKFEVIGIVDANPNLKAVSEVKVVGDDDILEKIFKSKCKNAFISVGSTGNPSVRVKLASKLKAIGFRLPAVIHPRSVIAKNALIGEGVFVAAAAVIGPDAKIGDNVIINTNSSVDHDCVISGFVHIAPGVTLSGGVKVGARTHIGTGSSIIEQVNIGADVVIGAGSVVVCDLPEGCKAYGTPCKEVGRSDG